MNVTFLLIDPELERLARIDPDRDWLDLVDGERAWVLQTYLRLKALGAPVAIADRPPREGIVVFSSKQRRVLRRMAPDTRGVTWVGLRGDLGEALIADFEIVQNPVQADGARRFFVPHWPQPALVCREPARDARVENIAFKGFIGNLADEFRDQRWRAWLAERRLGWYTDAVSYTRDEGQLQTLAWNDYRMIDVVLAVRPYDRDLHPRKPATKLYNAWHAGAVALLGPEAAYRAERRSPLDYIEVGSREEACSAIERLRSDPDLFRSMVENGVRRAQEVTAAAIAARWRALLFETIPAQAEAVHARFWRGRPMVHKELARRTARAFGLWK